MYVRAGRPAFARPCVGVHKSTSLMSSSLLLQQCPACLVRQLHKNAASNLEQVLAATPHKTPTVRPPASYHENLSVLDSNNQNHLTMGLLSRVFANGARDRSSIPCRVIPKTQKMVLDVALLNTQYYKVRIKSKVVQSRERSSGLPCTSV